MVEWIVGIRFVKKIDHPVNNCIDIQYRFPILAENVEADVPFKVDVWMVDLSSAGNLWRLMGVIWGNHKTELVRRSFPQP